MMDPLCKGSKTVESNIDSKEGGRGPLHSNKVDRRSPSLDFSSNNPLLSDEMLIDHLASILVEAFIEQKNYEPQE